MTRLRLAFMGTPDFAVPCLDALAAAGLGIAAVYTQPPRQAGRGKKPRPSPVQAAAERQGLEIRTPLSLKDAGEQAAFAALNLDAAVVVAYGLLLPKPVLAAPRLGCLNIHASLLPRWRGAAPIQRAIMAGDKETGVTIMQMDEGLDTGPILLREAIAIAGDETAGTLHDRLAALGARLIVQALDGLAAGMLTATPQPAGAAVYAAKLTRADEIIDWRRSADEIGRKVRALCPVPGAWFTAKGERIKLLAALAVDGRGEPGAILDDRLTIACGSGALRPLQLQRAGRGPVPAADFLRGFVLAPGTRLSLPAKSAT
ncbi:MAG: methionyl-tRNA formyltransferase [Dongiaceae bacterium]